MPRMIRNHTTLLALGVLGGTGVSGTGHPQQQGDFGTAPEFWLLLLLIVIFLAILAWWALSRRAAPSSAEPTASHATPARTAPPTPTPPKAQAVAAAPAAKPEPAPTPAAPVESAPVQTAMPAAPAPAEPVPAKPAPAKPAPAAPASGAPDDLRRIEGIGPKVEGALHALGITTYAQLATADPAALEQQIRDGGVRVLPGAPQTWPEQAALAAQGDWEGFEKLTARLKGGRRGK